MLLHQPVDYHAQRRPQYPAISAGDYRWDYATLVARSHAVAHQLVELGVTAGDRVAVLGLNSAAHFAVILGASRVGAVAVSINFRLSPTELAFILDDAEVNILFVTDNTIDDTISATLQARHLSTQVIANRADAVLQLSDVMTRMAPPFVREETVDENSPVLQLYTSGTTGKPKGAVLSHRNMNSLTHMMALTNDALYHSGTKNLVIAPLFHIGGAGVTYMGLVHGSHNLMHETFDPERVVSTIEREGVTTGFFVPAMIQAIVKLVPNVRERDFSSLEIIAYGAAPISASLLEEAMEVFGCDFAQVYGMTETTGTVIAMAPEDHRRAVAGEPGLLRSCGRPCPGNDVKIIDPQGLTLPPGETGEICLRSASNMLEYYNRPEATANTLRQGWIHTGDAGYVDSEGYIYIRDRMKDMVISGGENIYPVEVENVLAGIPGVIEVAVIGIPDDTFGEALMAIFALKAGASLSADEMITFCRDRLAGYKIPRQLSFVDALPRNPSGKILKTVLREPYWAGKDRQIA